MHLPAESNVCTSAPRIMGGATRAKAVGRIVRVETALHSGAVAVRVDDRLEVARLSKLQRYRLDRCNSAPLACGKSGSVE